jgi:hypothetical protein
MDVPCAYFTAPGDKSQHIWLSKCGTIVTDAEPFGVDIL